MKDPNPPFDTDRLLLQCKKVVARHRRATIAVFTLLLLGLLGWSYSKLAGTAENALASEEWLSYNAQSMPFKTRADFVYAEQTLKSRTTDPAFQGNPIPHYLLGELYQVMQQPKKANYHYQQAISLVENSWYNQVAYNHLKNEAYGGLALLAYQAGQPKEALAALSRMNGLEQSSRAELLTAMRDSLQNPERGDFHLLLGKRLWHDLYLAKAKEELNRAYSLGQSPHTKREASHYLQTQLPRHLVELSPLGRYFSLAGEARQLEEDPGLAANLYEQALREDPTFETGYNELAIIYRQLRDYPKAERNARQAARLNPDFFNPHLTLGDIALDQGRYQEAIRNFEQARAIIRRTPLEATRNLMANIENQIGFACESLNLHEDALRHYRLAMKAADAVGMDDAMAAEDYEYAQVAIQRVGELVDTRVVYGDDQVKKTDHLSLR